jgi:hypothetical protein
MIQLLLARDDRVKLTTARSVSREGSFVEGDSGNASENEETKSAV